MTGHEWIRLPQGRFTCNKCQRYILDPSGNPDQFGADCLQSSDAFAAFAKAVTDNWQAQSSDAPDDHVIASWGAAKITLGDCKRLATPKPAAPEIGAGLMDLEPAMVRAREVLRENMLAKPWNGNADDAFWRDARVTPGEAIAAMLAFSSTTGLMDRLRVEIERQCSIGAGMFEIDGGIDQSGLWGISADLDPIGLASALAAAPIPLGCDPVVRERDVDKLAKVYADATGYYVQFHRGLSSPSADKIREGVRAILAALSQSIPIDGR
ncbi:MAG TPA: hypothetical protein VF638_03025 [Sphingomonas sp.]|jgi:hypothetical protein